MSQSAQVSLSHLEEIAGANNVVTDAAELAARGVCGMRPSVLVRAADAAQIAEILRFSVREKLAVIPSGGGTKLSIGSPPTRYDIALDLSRMNRVLAYDPQDLTLGVEPGVRIEDLLRILAEQKQFLPLAVPFADRATLGGIVAANSSSPLRHAYGSARDFCLGMEFVTGEGSQAKSGGRVVKNVTGYDLHKLLVGSLGTLAVITRINFRTFPMPPAQGAFVASFSSAQAAYDFCHTASHSVLMPQMMEIADPRAARLLFSGTISLRLGSRAWPVILSVAGQPAVVDRYAREYGHMAGAANAEEFVHVDGSAAALLLKQICEFPRLILDAEPSTAIFRVNLAPGAIPSFLAALDALAERNGFDLATLTRAAGVMYAAFLRKEGREAAADSTARLIKETLHFNTLPEAHAHAMLEWCPAEVKRLAGDVWGPARQDFPLMQQVKNAFDPHHVLSPGRFAAGI